MAISARSTSGNILIYILGAIFLLGILIALVKGSFQEGAGIDPEKLLLRVNEVQRFGSEAERGIRYILQNGYSESQLRFARPDSVTYGLITDEPKRQLFSAEGGGVKVMPVPTDVLTAPADWVITAGNTALQVGSSCASEECTDLMLVLPNVAEAFCTHVNRLNNITNPAGEPPEDSDGFGLGYFMNGNSFAWTYSLNTVGDHTLGKTEGCFEGGTGDTVAGNYYYYRVLLTR